jgi:valyl-tRNA synthetase
MSQEKQEDKPKPRKYDPLTDEKQWQTFWEKNVTYTFNPDSTKEIYSIDTPPPTVSGKMHIGHAFSYTQEDFVARYQRMRGKSVFYPFGTDDNGLATERLIERTKKVKSKKMKRAEFIKLCNETLKEIRPNFIQGWKNIGMSCDFNVFYSTINDHSRKISQRSFIELFKEERVYQKKAPIIFCPNCKTAIAQVEMEDIEKKTTLNYIKAKMETGEFMIYATTRPELHPGCVGISLKEDGDYVTVETGKDDKEELWIISKDAVEKIGKEFPMKIMKEYKGKDLIGKTVTIPFAKGLRKVTHDLSAKTEYGTGIVFYCTYGGLDCVEWMARHTDVKPVHIMDETGVYTQGPCVGMNSADARKAILKELEKQGLLIKKEVMEHAVNTHERCGVDIEYIATKQWFIKYMDLRDHFIEAGKQMNWYPEHMRVRYDNWIRGLKWDWCISRQRYFGVPFPMWYCEDCNKPILADESQLPIDPLVDKPTTECECGSKKYRPEEDVLDTWATSSMTPHLAIELFKDHPNYNELKEKLFPMTLRHQAHDIITFWLFNTVVKSQMHHNKNPWEDIMISGHALDPKGRKMSKSKGNVVDPEEMIAKYGSDCLRFWSAGSKLGDDLPFMEKDLVTGKKMINKLWNAANFCTMHLQDFKLEKFDKAKLTPMDSWLLSKLNRVIVDATDSFEEYEYAKTRAKTEHFFWHTFCDNYLEIVKDRIYNPERRGKDGREAGQYCLYMGILTVLKLMAPIMPHITEAAYQEHFVKREKHASIHLSPWPEANIGAIKDDDVGDLIIDIIGMVRKKKSEKALSLKVDIKCLSITCTNEQRKGIESTIEDLKATTKSLKVEFESDKELKVEVEF